MKYAKRNTDSSSTVLFFCGGEREKKSVDVFLTDFPFNTVDLADNHVTMRIFLIY